MAEEGGRELRSISETMDVDVPLSRDVLCKNAEDIVVCFTGVDHEVFLEIDCYTKLSFENFLLNVRG